MADIETTHNEAANRYEARVDGRFAGFAEYVPDGDDLVFTHTEVEDEFGGRGVASAIATYALDDVRSQGGLGVHPQCSFIRRFIEKNPEYTDLVAGHS